MNTTAIILLILLLIYIPLWFIIWKNPNALKHGFQKYGPCIKINSSFGLKFIERFSRYHRFWRAFGIISQLISLFLMLLMIYMMVIAVINLPKALSQGSIGIEYALAVPGLNPMLPFWYGLLALIVALVCHEMAHGLQSRSNGIGVKHTGLLYAVVPLGAFVEPIQEEVEKASRRAKIDLYTAGISTNFVIAAIAFMIFSVGMLGSVDQTYFDNCAVYQESEDSPAYEAGIPAGAIIIEINGVPFDYVTTTTCSTVPQYPWEPGTSVNVTYRTENGTNTANMIWGTYIEKTVDDSPASGMSGKFIRSIGYEGQDYYFYTAVGFTDFMKMTQPGKEAVINYTEKDGTPGSRTVTLGTNGSIGYLGIYTDTSGMGLITPRIMHETAANPLYNATDINSVATGLLSYMTHPFSGFVPVPESVQWWYGEQSDAFWIICQVFYWIFWLNIMLGITNALPAFPFDGGYVFLGWVDAILEKMGKKDKAAREAQAMEITRNLSSFMIFLYLLVIFAALF